MGLSVSNLSTDCARASKVLSSPGCGLILAQGTSHRPATDYSPSRDVDHYIVITGISCDGANHPASYETLDPAYALTTQNNSTFTIVTMYGVVK